MNSTQKSVILYMKNDGNMRLIHPCYTNMTLDHFKVTYYSFDEL